MNVNIEHWTQQEKTKQNIQSAKVRIHNICSLCSSYELWQNNCSNERHYYMHSVSYIIKTEYEYFSM